MKVWGRTDFQKVFSNWWKHHYRLSDFDLAEFFWFIMNYKKVYYAIINKEPKPIEKISNEEIIKLSEEIRQIIESTPEIRL